MIFIVAVFATPAIASDCVDFKATEKAAIKKKFKGARCGIFDNMVKIQSDFDPANGLPEKTQKHVYKKFMSYIYVMDKTDFKFETQSIVDDITFFIATEYGYTAQIGVKTNHYKQRGEILVHEFLQPLGFKKFKNRNGFDIYIMVFKPFNPFTKN